MGVILAGMCLALACCAWRLGSIQLGTHADLAAAAAAQNSVAISLEEFPRGQICDRHGYSLLQPVTAERVVVIPHYITDKRTAARRLAAVLGTEEAPVRAGLDHPGILPYALDRTQASQIRGMREAGVLVMPVHLRYGAGARAPHVTGHLGKIGSETERAQVQARTGRNYGLSDWVGKSGVEAYYEGFLRGQRPMSFIRSHFDARYAPLPGLDQVVRQTDPARGDVMLTLDARIQAAAEKAMAGVRAGSLVVSDVHTGDILALVSVPAYTVRDPAADSPAAGDVFYNRATALYQPGSVFKMVVAAAALETGAVTADTHWECGGAGDPLITCWYAEGHGEIGLARAFAESCNPFFARLGLGIGADVIVRYAEQLGLSDQTILGFPFAPDPRQDPSLIREPFSLANAGIGQGPVLASPVQVNALTATIANGGRYITPRLVDRVEDQSGVRLLDVPPAAPRRVLTPETAEIMRQLMLGVTTRGQGRDAYLEEGGSAGKTGSAQVGDTGRVNAWFTGYFPAGAPRYALTVLVEDGISGGASAAPLFREAAAAIVRVTAEYEPGGQTGPEPGAGNTAE